MLFHFKNLGIDCCRFARLSSPILAAGERALTWPCTDVSLKRAMKLKIPTPATPTTSAIRRWQPRLRTVAGAASTLLLSFLLASCRPSARQPVTVTVLDPEWSQPDELPAAEHESLEFTRETGVLVKHLPVPETSLSQLGLWRKLLQEGGPSPDVLGIDIIWPGILNEYLIDLKPYAATELSSEDPELVASYTVNGRVVALPYHPQIGVLSYRTDLLREYGYQQPPKTWDELEKMAARIQAGERAKGKKDFWGYIWQGAAGESLTCDALEWQAAEGGGRIIENDKTISVNNPAAIRSWQRAAHWIGWISPPGIVAYRELDGMNVWNSGLAAFRRTWQSEFRLSHWQMLSIGDVVGYTSVPGGPGGRAATLGGTGFGGIEVFSSSSGSYRLHPFPGSQGSPVQTTARSFRASRTARTLRSASGTGALHASR